MDSFKDLVLTINDLDGLRAFFLEIVLVALIQYPSLGGTQLPIDFFILFRNDSDQDSLDGGHFSVIDQQSGSIDFLYREVKSLVTPYGWLVDGQ